METHPPNRQIKGHGSSSTTFRPMSIVNKYSAVAEMDDRLAATEMDRKLGWLCPFGGQTGQTDRQTERQAGQRSDSNHKANRFTYGLPKAEGWIKMPLGTGLASPRPHCVRWGPSYPPQKGDSPQFSSHVWPNGWMDQ